MPNYMKKAGMDYGHGGSKPKKKKLPSMKKGGERYSGTPTSLPGGCGGKRKKY